MDLRRGRPLWMPSLLATCTASTLLLGALPVDAADDGDCRERAARSRRVELDGITTVSIDAGAGALEVRGRPGLRELRADGEACARTRADLEAIRLEVTRRGDTLEVQTRLPRSSDYASLDLAVELPDDVAVAIRDSSGSIDVLDVRSLSVEDSSGSITVQRVAEGVHVIEDSSGSIEIRDVGGEVLIDEDSSGSIEVVGAASVRIIEDSSGSITVRDVAGDVFVGRDSSGSISVADVGGDFTVERDSSGGVQHRNVAGVVRVGDDDWRRR